MKNIKFAFFGTPEVASRTLEILIDHGYTPDIVITNKDMPAGRGLVLTKTPVKIVAEKHNIKVLTPEKISSEFISEMRSLDYNLFIVVAYGKIFPEEFIKLPKLGTINIHYSLLPKHRGASPLEQALLDGDEVTGISIQQMEYKLDSGSIITKKEVPIRINETKEELRKELIELGANTLCEVLPKIINKEITPEIQNENLATFCGKIKKEDGQIDINGNARENYNKYRAFSGWPGVYFFVNKNGKPTRVKITKAKYENDSFIIERVIPEGKKEISYDEFLRSITLK